MKKKTISSGNCLGMITALIVFFIGLAVTVFTFWTIIGAIVGVLMMIAALFMGGKTRKVWKCRSCGSVVDRA